MNKKLKGFLLTLGCVGLFVIFIIFSASYARYLINFNLIYENKQLKEQVTELKHDNEVLNEMLKHSLVITQKAIRDYENMMKTSVPGYNDLLQALEMEDYEINIGKGGERQLTKIQEKDKKHGN